MAAAVHVHPFLDVLVDMLMPLKRRHTLLIVPLIIALLALVFYGSLAIRTVMVTAAFVVTLVVFAVTLNHLLRALPPWLAVLLSTVAAVACAVFAAQSAVATGGGGVGAGTTTALGFAFGAVAIAVADGLGAGFADALPGHPALGETCAVLAAGLLCARLSWLPPPHTTAAASTALVGAYGVAACVRVIAASASDDGDNAAGAAAGAAAAAVVDSGPLGAKAEALLTLVLGISGFAAQTCCCRGRSESHSGDRGNAREPSPPYEQI